MSRPYAEIWPPARVADLLRLRATGLSCLAVSEQLGVTRNAVIGKLRRLNAPLPERLASVAPATPVPPARPKRPPPRLPNADRIRMVTVEPASRNGHHLTILNLRSGQCRWLHDGGYYCGQPTEGSYCRGHAALVYLPSRRQAAERRAS